MGRVRVRVSMVRSDSVRFLVLIFLFYQDMMDAVIRRLAEVRVLEALREEEEEE